MYDKILQVGTYFTFNKDLMRQLKIKPVTPIDNHQEIWSFVVLDKHHELQELRKYLISNYGRVYDLENHELMTFLNGAVSSNGYRYKTVTLHVKKKSGSVVYLVHRLVALAFIPQIEDKPFVNHIDACPEHNWVWNLEWCNASENYWHAHKMGLINQPRGEARPNSMWTEDEIRLICSMMAEGHKATYIYKALGDILKDEKVTYERVRSLYKHIVHRTHWTHISKDYDIDFTPFNYSKEQASTKLAKMRKKAVDAIKD